MMFIFFIGFSLPRNKKKSIFFSRIQAQVSRASHSEISEKILLVGENW